MNHQAVGKGARGEVLLEAHDVLLYQQVEAPNVEVVRRPDGETQGGHSSGEHPHTRKELAEADAQRRVGPPGCSPLNKRTKTYPKSTELKKVSEHPWPAHEADAEGPVPLWWGTRHRDVYPDTRHLGRGRQRGRRQRGGPTRGATPRHRGDRPDPRHHGGDGR